MRCELCKRPAWYRCGRTGVPICPVHASLEVVASRPNEGRSGSFEVRAARLEEYPCLKQMAVDFWGETEMECFEGVYDVTQLPAFAGLAEDQLVGFLSYAIEEDALNIVMLNVLPEHQGAGLGQELMKAVIGEAGRRNLSRLIVGTSNDNLPALDFYQRLGFVIKEVVPGRIVECHGGIEEGFAGIGVRDEIRLELALADLDPCQ